MTDLEVIAHLDFPTEIVVCSTCERSPARWRCVATFCGCVELMCESCRNRVIVQLGSWPVRTCSGGCAECGKRFAGLPPLSTVRFEPLL